MDQQATDTTMKCPTCRVGTLSRQLILEEFDFELAGETFKAIARDVPVKRCNHCDEQLRGAEAAKVCQKAMCTAADLLTPEETRSLREGLNLSQDELADITGFEITMLSRWERGRLVQDRASDNLLRLLAECPESLRVLQERLRERRGKTTTTEAVPLPFPTRQHEQTTAACQADVG